MENQVLEISKKEIESVIRLVKGKNIDVLRDMQDSLIKEIANTQRQIEFLRVQYSYIQGKMDIKSSVSEIENNPAEKYMTADPVQSYDPSSLGTPPIGDITYAKNKLSETIIEMLKYQEDIKNKINRLQEKNSENILKLKDLKASTEEKESPTDLDQEKSRLKSIMLKNVYLLYNLHRLAYNLTNNTKDENGCYSEDRKILNTMTRIKEKFRAFVENNPRYLQDPNKLDLNKPESLVNRRILQRDIERFKIKTEEDFPKYEKKIEKYTNSLVNSLNDPFISKNINKDFVGIYDRSIEKNGSQQEKTKNLATFFENTRDSLPKFFEWYTKIDGSISSFFEAKQKRTQRNIKDLFRGNPFCSGDPPKTAEETIEDDYREEKEDQTKKAFDELNEELEKNQ